MIDKSKVGQTSPEAIKFEPVDLATALKGKPRESSISFKGMPDQSIRFVLPIRKFHFDDYLSFFAAALMTGFFGWLCYTTILIWEIWGVLFSLIVSGGLIYWFVYEKQFFKEQQVIQIGRSGLKLERYYGKKQRIISIPLDDIRSLTIATSSPVITYYDEEKNEVKEKMFMEYCQRSEKQWITMILRSIIYNVTQKVV